MAHSFNETVPGRRTLSTEPAARTTASPFPAACPRPTSTCLLSAAAPSSVALASCRACGLDFSHAAALHPTGASPSPCMCRLAPRTTGALFASPESWTLPPWQSQRLRRLAPHAAPPWCSSSASSSSPWASSIGILSRLWPRRLSARVLYSRSGFIDLYRPLYPHPIAFEHTTPNPQHTQHTTHTHNTQHTIHNTQHTAHNTQYTTHNAQRPTPSP